MLQIPPCNFIPKMDFYAHEIVNIFSFIWAFVLLPLLILLVYYFKKYPLPTSLIGYTNGEINNFKDVYNNLRLRNFKLWIPLIIIIPFILLHIYFVYSSNAYKVSEYKKIQSETSVGIEKFDSVIDYHYKGICLEDIDSIYTGMYLTNLYDIDILNNSFKASMWVWFRYRDSSYRDLMANNFIDILDASDIDIRMKYTNPQRDAQEYYLSWYFLNVTFVKDWNVINYPFDNHTIKIEYETAYPDCRYLKFKLDTANSGFDKRTTFMEWKVTSSNHNVSGLISNYKCNFGDLSLPDLKSHYTSCRMQLEIERNYGLVLYLKIFSGLFAAFIICLLGFLVTVDSVARFSLHAAGILTAITNKLSIDKIIPQYFNFTLSDYIHLIFLELMILVIFVSTLQLSQLRRGWTQVNGDPSISISIVQKSIATSHYYAGVFWSLVAFIYALVLCIFISLFMAYLPFNEILR